MNDQYQTETSHLRKCFPGLCASPQDEVPNLIILKITSVSHVRIGRSRHLESYEGPKT